MHKSITIFVVGSVAVGLLVAGCGGSGGSAGTQRIDKATFVNQANKICEQVSGTMAAEFALITQKESAKPSNSFNGTEILLLKKVFIPGFEEELQKIRALGIPDEAKKEDKAFLETYQQSIDKMTAKPEIIVTQSLPPYEPIELAGTKFGVDECPIAPVNAGSAN